jgi:Ca2+ transporting ATPase
VWWFLYYADGPQITWGQLSHFHSCGLQTQSGQTYFGDEFFVQRGFTCDMFDDNRPDTIALSILVTIEMFNTFNALSENQSLLSNPSWSNIWVVLAVALSIGLHCVILYVDFFRTIFSTADLNQTEWTAVLLISFPVILLDEVLKLISRQIAASSAGKEKTKRD